jgi:hypothetical protein
MNEDLLSECRNLEAIRRDPMALQRLGGGVSKAIAAGRIGGPNVPLPHFIRKEWQDKS